MPEYWILDADNHTLERLVLRDGSYFIADALAGEVVFRPTTFEGLEVPLGVLWKAIEDAG